SGDDLVAKITAGDLTIVSGGGIGSANAIEVDVTRLDFRNTVGNVQITDLAGGLTVADLGVIGAGQHGNFAAGGGSSIIANSPLTITTDLSFAGDTNLIA